MKTLIVALILICSTAQAELIEFEANGEWGYLNDATPFTTGDSFVVNFSYDIDTPKYTGIQATDLAFYFTGAISLNNEYFANEENSVIIWNETEQLYGDAPRDYFSISGTAYLKGIKYSIDLKANSHDNFFNNTDLPTEINSGGGFSIAKWGSPTSIEWMAIADFDTITRVKSNISVPEPSTLFIASIALMLLCMFNVKRKNTNI